MNMSSRWPPSRATSKQVRKWRRAYNGKRRNSCARYDLAVFLAVFGPEKRTNKSKFREGFPRRRRRDGFPRSALLQKFTSEMCCVRKSGGEAGEADREQVEVGSQAQPSDVM